jgi:hypothetical protein
MEEKTASIDIDFHYLKTNGYRSYYVDGAFGGITPSGSFYMELFLERQATPQLVHMRFSSSESTLGEAQELGREGKTGIVREIECGLVFDLATARALHTWLGQKIESWESTHGSKSE